MRALSPLLPLLPLVAACGHGGPPLHEREAFAGELQVEIAGGEPFECGLTFRRSDGRLNLTLERDGIDVTLARDAEGRLRAFVTEVWRDPEPLEVEQFQVVESLVQPSAGEAAVAGEAGEYTVTVDGRPVEVRILNEREVPGGG